jgi:TIR domain
MTCHVFISYGRGDREMVAAIARRLEERGLTVWYDARIAGEDGFNAEIAAALTSATITALFFSDECNSSRQVAQELALADSLGKPVVPILLEAATPRGSLLLDLADRCWLQAYPEPRLHADGLATLLAHIAGLHPPGAPPQVAPTNPDAYVGRQDADGSPSTFVTGKTYRILNALTLGLYGLAVTPRAIRAFESNIRKP